MPLNPDVGKPFKITCDWCGGSHRVGAFICPKCEGAGYICVTPIRPRVSFWRWLRDRWRWLKWFSLN